MRLVSLQMRGSVARNYIFSLIWRYYVPKRDILDTAKYHWFRQHIGKEFVIRKIKSENKKADISPKGLQVPIFVRMRKLQCGW